MYRIAGLLSVLLGNASFVLGDFPAAYAHLLTAEQLAREVGDHRLLTSVKVDQSTVALWDGDVEGALSLAREGLRYPISGAQRALLAVRCEARALARKGDRSGVFEALRRAERELPGQPLGDDPDGGWWLCTPGDLELYTGITLLWLGQPGDAARHARHAITCYQTAPAALQYPGNQAQSQINLAICQVHQGHPEEGVRLATDALGITRSATKPCLQQAGDLLTILTARYRDLAATREFADRLRSLRSGRG